MKLVKTVLIAGALGLLALLPSDGALAQSVSALPAFVKAGAVLDLGAGPLETRVVQGSAFLQAPIGTATSGSATSASTTLALAAAPTLPPIVGGVIQGLAITAGTTVAAYNSSTHTITLSAAMTVAAATPLTYAVACPTAPSGAIAQRVPDKDLPWYTTAHVCAFGGEGSSADIVTFAIGAH